MEELGINLEIALGHNNLSIKHRCAYILRKTVTNPHIVNNHINHEHHIVKKLETKISTKNVTLCKVDKGNTLVILDKVDYNSKMNNFLKS